MHEFEEVHTNGEYNSAVGLDTGGYQRQRNICAIRASSQSHMDDHGAG